MRRISLLFAVAAIAVFLEGCTKSFLCGPNKRLFNVTYARSNPRLEEINASVPPDVAAIVVIRYPQFVKCAVPMYFQLDGEEIGPLATHTHVIVYVPPGEHELNAQDISVWSPKTRSVSGKIRMEADAGRAYYVSGQLGDGSVNLRLLSGQEASKWLKSSRRVLTPTEKKQEPR